MAMKQENTSPSMYVEVAAAVTLLAMAKAGWSEVNGTNLNYAKFAKKENLRSIKLTSKTGMLVFYAPSLVASAAFLALHSPSSSGLAFALTMHFLKRCLEVLFVHKFGGHMDLQTAILVFLNYLWLSMNLLYARQILESSPSVGLSMVGWGLYWLGMGGNLYHHLILSSLRSRSDEKRYVMPRGGLFSVVVCPHYLFEIVEWFGIACISQTRFGWVVSLGTLFYLGGRSNATRKWYLAKFEAFPKHRKAVIPFLF